MKDPLWWRDQGYHALAGLVVSGGVVSALAYGAELHVALCAFVAVLVSGIAAIAYEAIQNWGDKPEVGSQMDSIFDLGGMWLGTSLGLLAALWA